MNKDYTFHVTSIAYDTANGLFIAEKGEESTFTLHSKKLKEVFRYLNQNQYFVNLDNVPGDAIDYFDSDVDITKPIVIRGTIASVCIDLDNQSEQDDNLLKSDESKILTNILQHKILTPGDICAIGNVAIYKPLTGIVCFPVIESSGRIRKYSVFHLGSDEITFEDPNSLLHISHVPFEQVYPIYLTALKNSYHKLGSELATILNSGII